MGDLNQTNSDESPIELLQGDRVPAEIEKKEDKGNEAATINDINEVEEKIGADKTKEDDEAVKWKPKSR